MTNHLAVQKTKARAHVRALLAAMTPEQRAADSARVCAILAGQTVWHWAKTVLFYAPLPSELDIWPLALEALAAGKRIALPRFESAAATYAASIIEDPARDLLIGQWGIREPGRHCKLIPGTEIELALVPGVAFDWAGHRLGRGKGYYDRLLRTVRGLKCGVGFEQQIVSTLPAEPHDQRLDYILTPTRWIAVSARQPQNQSAQTQSDV